MVLQHWYVPYEILLQHTKLGTKTPALPHTRHRDALPYPVAVWAALGMSSLALEGQPVSGLLRPFLGLGMSDVYFIVTDKKWQHLKCMGGEGVTVVSSGLERFGNYAAGSGRDLGLGTVSPDILPPPTRTYYNEPEAKHIP